MNKKFYIELIFLILLGALTSLSLPPFNYFLLNFLTFSLFYIFLIKKYDFKKNKKILKDLIFTSVESKIESDVEVGSFLS